MKTVKIIQLCVLLFTLQAAEAQSNVGFKMDVESYAKSLRLPTLVVGVAERDSLIFFTGIGSASADAKKPISSDHIFPIASVTKSFTSVVLQQLESEGRISINDLIDNYPNRYFTKDRWTRNTSIAHILSHTSESRPVGTNFVYNGSKYNIVFNVFTAINPQIDSAEIARPFTNELERRIIDPLKMNHTFVRYTESRHSTLTEFGVTPYVYNDSTGTYWPDPADFRKIECGPGFGMRSSVNDLVKYSRALDLGILISNQRFKKITSPFYTGSVYGQGWFTSTFEGVNIAWAYGYGNSDAAILLKVPSKELTLVLLSSCSMPSATTRLGFGNPLNSPIVCSFLRNYVFNQQAPTPNENDYGSFEEAIRKNKKESKSRLYIEEAFASATVALFSPTTNTNDREKNIHRLKVLMRIVPEDTIWQSATAFELMASLNDSFILKFGSKLSEEIVQAQNIHPAKLYFAGVIHEKSGNMSEAIRLFRNLADGEVFNEQGYKFDALMKLARYFADTDTDLSKYYLGKIIEYKEYISAIDKQYNEAKEMYLRL